MSRDRAGWPEGTAGRQCGAGEECELQPGMMEGLAGGGNRSYPEGILAALEEEPPHHLPEQCSR